MRLIFITLLFFILSPEDDEYFPTTFVFPAYKHTYGIRKAGPTELFLFMGFRVKFRDPQDLACTRLDAWEDPDDPHDDDELTVYGVNSGQNNIIYNTSMWDLGVYGLYEEGEQRLNRPRGICANSRGDVYIADTGNHRIVRLFNPGHQLGYVTAIGTKGNGEGQFIYPHQVALDNSGNLFASDSGNHRIQVFDNTNKFRYSFNGDGFLQGPTGIALTDSLEKYSNPVDSFIIIIDSLNQRLSKFSLQGKWLKSIRTTDITMSRANLEYVCLDFYNQIIVTDSKNHCLHKFNSDLEYIVSFGREGDDDFEFESPRGIAIYRRFGQLFIAEETGAQYYWVGTDIKDIKTSQKQDTLSASFYITEPSNVTVDILDRDHQFVMRLMHGYRYSQAGQKSLKWNLIVRKPLQRLIENEELELSSITQSGQKAPAGVYYLKFSLEATYSSRTHFVREETKEFYLSGRNDEG